MDPVTQQTEATDISLPRLPPTADRRAESLGHQNYYFIGGNVFKLQDLSCSGKHLLPKSKDGNILLAGDAAHVHSPVGGRGMNLSICDAVAICVRISISKNSLKRNKHKNTSLPTCTTIVSS